MKRLKALKENTGGFTLIELLIVIACAAAITFGASQVLLFGMNANDVTMKQAETQNTARTVSMLLETLASQGDIQKVESSLDGWALLDKDDQVILQYDPSYASIQDRGGNAVLEGVFSSDLSMKTADDDPDDGLTTGALLTLNIYTEEGPYTSSIYSRTVAPAYSVNGETVTEAKEEIEAIVDITQARKDFLTALLQELTLFGTPGHTPATYNSIMGFPANTAWCACFVTYVMEEELLDVHPDYLPAKYPENYLPSGKGWFIHTGSVDKYFDRSLYSANQILTSAEVTSNPGKVQPGDLVFFDWNRNGQLDHVGVVAQIKANDNGIYFLYTIEGNTSNSVAIRRYLLASPVIVGYRILPWGETN